LEVHFAWHSYYDAIALHFERVSAFQVSGRPSDCDEIFEAQHLTPQGWI
jgi:hypothetical protein